MMAGGKTDIWVYADWMGMDQPKCIGIFSAHQGKGRKAFSFAYDREWVHSQEQLMLDPDIGWYSGDQFPVGKENFGIILDSMPDRWGRTLMKRRALQLAKNSSQSFVPLHEIDFLLGVQDESRMGALRFKRDPDGPFLAADPISPIPPFSSIRELQFAAQVIEQDEDSKAIRKWLSVLLAPGSSLGGARPKANVYDHNKQLWIAKFPSKNDAIDQGAWEYLTYKLAVKAGIDMADSQMKKVAGDRHTFLTKRFDRLQNQRVHFASAMTMTGQNEDTLKDYQPSYLDIAEFIQFSGAKPLADLHQLWRRMVFNIAVSNTDDHLRNHGFLLTAKGWILAPAYDLNPSIDKAGLSLNIDTEYNAPDFELAQSVGEYFQLSEGDMSKIVGEVKSVVGKWRKLASDINLTRQEQEMMEPAFRY